MAHITLKGNPVNTVGDLPEKGSTAGDFRLVSGDLSNVSLANFEGKRKLLNILPSLDTPVCQLSTRKFNESAAKMDNTAVLVISADLPFAQQRFCSTENIENVTALSTMRDQTFAHNYGVGIVDGPLEGVLARAVIVLDENNQVLHSQLVGEIADEPDYDAAIQSLSEVKA